MKLPSPWRWLVDPSSGRSLYLHPSGLYFEAFEELNTLLMPCEVLAITDEAVVAVAAGLVGHHTIELHTTESLCRAVFRPVASLGAG